jgi:hypothetical protein
VPFPYGVNCFKPGLLINWYRWYRYGTGSKFIPVPLRSLGIRGIKLHGTGGTGINGIHKVFYCSFAAVFLMGTTLEPAFKPSK